MNDNWFRRVQAVRYARAFLGQRYGWGGQGLVWDCSGIIVEVLRRDGTFTASQDTNSQGLFDMFPLVSKALAGGIACYGKSRVQISHVMMCINSTHCIGASGGNSRTRALLDAIKRQAFVKERPIHYRGDLIGIVDPFKEG